MLSKNADDKASNASLMPNARIAFQT